MKKPKRRATGVLSPEAQATRDAFVAYKKEHPEVVPYEELTPIQKRMQSGGVGVTTEEFREVVEEATKIRPNKKTFPKD